jgi:hypothetical protein
MPSLDVVTPEFLDSAPFRVVAEKTVLAPIDACWELIADQAAWVQWFDGMSSVDATPWHWSEPGHTRVVNVNGIKVHEVGISVMHEQEYAFAITKWPLPIAKRAAEAVRLEDRTNGGSPRTKLTYIGAFELTRLAGFAEGLLQKQFSDTWLPALTALGELANERVANRD